MPFHGAEKSSERERGPAAAPGWLPVAFWSPLDFAETDKRTNVEAGRRKRAPLRGNVEPELTGGECECEGSSKSQDCKELESRRWNEVEINFKINSELVPGSGLRCGWRDSI